MTTHLYVDNDPEHDGPTTAEVAYADLDPDDVLELAMQGDKGAVDFINAQEDIG